MGHYEIARSAVLGFILLLFLVATVLLFTGVIPTSAQQPGQSFTLNCDALDSPVSLDLSCFGSIPHTPTPAAPTATPGPTNTPAPTPTNTPNPPTPTPTSTPTSTPVPGQLPIVVTVKEGVDMGDVCCVDPGNPQGHTFPRYQPLIQAGDRIVGAPNSIFDETRCNTWKNMAESLYPGQWLFYHASGNDCGAPEPIYIEGTDAGLDATITGNQGSTILVNHSTACAAGPVSFAAAVDALPAHPDLAVGFTVGQSFPPEAHDGVSGQAALDCYAELEQRGVTYWGIDHPLAPGPIDSFYEAIRGITIIPRPTSSPQCAENGNVSPCWPPVGTP